MPRARGSCAGVGEGEMSCAIGVLVGDGVSAEDRVRTDGPSSALPGRCQTHEPLLLVEVKEPDICTHEARRDGRRGVRLGVTGDGAV
jgi:hypothetical protein